MDKLTLSRINRRDVSRKIGIDVGHISRIFSGKSKPSVSVARKIANYLHVSMDELCDMLGIEVSDGTNTIAP